jgi:hypothetical protein
MKRWACSLLACAAAGVLAGQVDTNGVAGVAPPAALSIPLIADNQQFLALAGTTDNKGLFKNTYQNLFRVKVAATDLVFPFVQTYSSWNDSEAQKEFDNPATYRAAVSINHGPWRQLTWAGAERRTVAMREVITNDPLKVEVKPGDTLHVRTEITVPPGGKWGLGPQAQGDAFDPDPNWTGGGVNTAEDVLLSDKADFRPQAGLFTHTSQGVFGKPVGRSAFHPVIILGDSISPYVATAVSKIGDAVPIMYFGQPAESAGRFWRAGEGRQKLLGGYESMLYQYGVNDLRSRRAFEDLKSDAVNTWKAFRAAGGRHLMVFTSTPLSTSSNQWQTLEGQRPEFEPDVRARWNEFLRALNEGQTGLNVTIIDTAALLESTPSSSMWRLTPEGKPATDDGCHPNAAGYAWIEKELGESIRLAILSQP